MKTTLSIEAGLAHQAEDLNRYRSVLHEDIFPQFKARVQRDNHQAKTGYDITRGEHLYEILCNEFMKAGPDATPASPTKPPTTDQPPRHPPPLDALLTIERQLAEAIRNATPTP